MLARLFLLANLLALCLATVSRVVADEPVDDGAAFFEQHVRPLLATRCWKCHGPDKQQASLRLDSPGAVAAGGDSGPVIVPGKPAESPMILAIEYGDDLKMPPDGKLNDSEVALLTRWVKSGAAWPKYSAEPQAEAAVDGELLKPPTPGKRDPLWALRPMSHPTVPQVTTLGEGASDIDRFILARLESESLTPAPAADRRTLVRRAYCDLLGLPPTIDEVEAFLADHAPDAFARLIDKLLASPHYGERWGRHWLDVARYADSGGYETDMYFRNAWRYRDYVVKSFNDDKPYDRFVQEQIAGDELWPDDLALAGTYVMPAEKLKHLEARIGTGLYALGPQVHESNMDGRKLDYERLTDWADTTGSVFLGLTLGCARCHDHKFDPISQRDYYNLQAVFAGSHEVEIPLVNGMEIADFKQFYPRILAVDEARRAFRLFEGQVKARKLSPDEEAQRRELRDKIAAAVLELPEAAGSTPNDRFDGLMEIPTASVLGHLEPQLVPPVHILHRGDLDRPKRAATPDLPRSLRSATNYREPLGGQFTSRKQLALWLTAPEHPLTARVMANRVWQWHFVTGLVATGNDFGMMGTPPSHPELLDYLARRLVQGDWSLKKLHREIMLSQAYQRASAYINPDNLARDADNRLLWRMNRRRLEAEALWDYVHATAGTINLKIGGRPVVPTLESDELSALREPWQWTVSADPKEHTRRGLYVIVRRNFRFPMFEVFDAPINSFSSARRDTTVVAPQTLWSLNNRRAWQQAQHLAARAVREVGPDPATCVERAWRIALARAPSATEKTQAVQLVEQLAADTTGAPLENPPAELAAMPAAQGSGLAKVCLAILNLNEFVWID